MFFFFFLFEEIVAVIYWATTVHTLTKVLCLCQQSFYKWRGFSASHRLRTMKQREHVHLVVGSRIKENVAHISLLGCVLLLSVDSLVSLVCLDFLLGAGILNLTGLGVEVVAMDKQCVSPMIYIRIQALWTP